MVTFTVARLRLTWALLTGVLLIALFNGVIAVIGDVGVTRVVSNTLLISAAVLGATAAYLFFPVTLYVAPWYAALAQGSGFAAGALIALGRALEKGSD